MSLKRKRLNIEGLPHFALIQYEELDTYNVIKANAITENKKGQTVAKNAGSKYLVTVVYKNSCEVVLQELAYNLNHRYPVVEINDLKHTKSTENLEDETNSEQAMVIEGDFVLVEDRRTEHFTNEINFEPMTVEQDLVSIEDISCTKSGHLEDEVNSEQTMVIEDNFVLIEDRSRTITEHFTDEINFEKTMAVEQDLVSIEDISCTKSGHLEDKINSEQTMVIEDNFVSIEDRSRTITEHFTDEINFEKTMAIEQDLVSIEDISCTKSGHLEDEINSEQTMVIEDNFVSIEDRSRTITEHFTDEINFEKAMAIEQDLVSIEDISCTRSGHLEDEINFEQTMVIEEDLIVDTQHRAGKKRVSAEPSKQVKVDMRSLVVPNSLEKSKRYFCVYCMRQVTNFGRHLLTLHKNEEDVAQILKYPKAHPTRSTLIGKIRKKGQFMFNTSNINTGTLMVSRRPSKRKNRTTNHFLVCPYCKEMYSKLSLRVHAKKCLENEANKGQKNYTIGSRQCVIHIHPSAKDRLARDVFPYCRRDHITELMSFDELCVLYGNKLVTKYKEQRHNPMIRSRLRSVGTFLYTFIKSNPNVKSLKEILDPSNYDQIVDTINKTAGLDETGRYKAPSTAYALGLQLKSIASMYESQCIKEKAQEKRAAARDLLTLFNDGFQIDINKTVMENQSEMKRQKKVKLPTKEDILALKNYLDKGVTSAYLKLSTSVSLVNWKQLAGFTLISLQLFNRRRAGEIERILIKDFHSYEFVNESDEAYQKMETNLKRLASLYGRFFIRGKLNRQVPVLVNRDMINYINVLLQHREAIGVLDDNPYVFGTPGSRQNHLKACDLMRKYSTECGAPNPDTLRGTELRKQIATACSLYNLPDLLVDDVAKHLGHHTDIHKNIYRQSTANQIPSMVNILRKALGDNEEEEEVAAKAEKENKELLKTAKSSKRDSLIEAIIDEGSEFAEQPTSSEPDHLTEADSDEDYVQSRSPTPEIKVPKKRVSWSNEEKATIYNSMEDLIKQNIVPTYEECINLKSKSPCLEKRTPPQIKAFVAYQSKKLKTPGVARHYWTSEEQKVVLNNFQIYFKQKTLPSLPFCRQVITDNPVLKSRTPEMLKAHINNMNNKKRKTLEEKE